MYTQGCDYQKRKKKENKKTERPSCPKESRPFGRLHEKPHQEPSRRSQNVQNGQMRCFVSLSKLIWTVQNPLIFPQETVFSQSNGNHQTNFIIVEQLARKKGKQKKTIKKSNCIISLKPSMKTRRPKTDQKQRKI